MGGRGGGVSTEGSLDTRFYYIYSFSSCVGTIICLLTIISSHSSHFSQYQPIVQNANKQLNEIITNNNKFNDFCEICCKLKGFINATIKIKRTKPIQNTIQDNNDDIANRKILFSQMLIGDNFCFSLKMTTSLS